MFRPFQDVCIDESPTECFGIKLFEICDVECTYIFDFIIYTGATTDLNDEMVKLGTTTQIVDKGTGSLWYSQV